MGAGYDKKYNLLTKRLLEKGYTADHHPDFVKVNAPFGAEKSLDNYEGGLVFERWWVFKQTFRTPCGLQCKGMRCHSHMSYRGIDWTYENDMAAIHCPYEKRDCSLRHRYLQEHSVLKFACEVHMTAEEYCYEGSVEQILKLHDDEIRRKKIRRLRCDLEGTLFEGQVDREIIKGQKLFAHPVSLDICRACVKICQDRIRDKERSRYSRELFFSKYHGRDFAFEIQNVRAKRRESRDLMQDLADIRDGIKIVHVSDREKRQAEAKRAKRQKSHEAAVRRLEKILLEKGYDHLAEYSADRRHADKWLGQARIAELEELRREREKEKREQPVQMNLFDMGMK